MTIAVEAPSKVAGWTKAALTRYAARRARRGAAPAERSMHDEDFRPRKPATHEIGQKLDELSVGDLAERIALLHAEIERLEAAKTAKEAARMAAVSIFKS